MSDIGHWFNSLPRFTRYWFGGTIALSVLGRFGLINPMYLYLLYKPVVHHLQIWRPVTALFYYPISPGTGFHFLINLYFLYSYSLRLETDQFNNKPADYFMLLFFNWFTCVVIALFADLVVLMDPMVLSVLYIWCQLNKDVIVTFWFGTRFKAMYLPWVLFGFNLIVSGGGIMELIGIFVGHLYFFLKFRYPQEMGGPQLIQTPSLFSRWFPSRGGPGGNIPRPSQPGSATNYGFRGYNWGPGQTLGSG